MEKEIKLIFCNESDFNRMKNELSKEPEFHEIRMNAIYMDTLDDSLSNSGVAMRIRRENDNIVLTVKDNGSASGGMHTRKEWNVQLDSEEIDFKKIYNSNIDTTDSVTEFFDIIELVRNKGLKEICRTEFVRLSAHVTDGESVAEICLDRGKIISGEKSLPILESEFELHSGKDGYIEELARKYSEEYNLTPENVSKFARGLELYLSCNS